MPASRVNLSSHPAINGVVAERRSHLTCNQPTSNFPESTITPAAQAMTNAGKANSNSADISDVDRAGWKGTMTCGPGWTARSGPASAEEVACLTVEVIDGDCSCPAR